MKKIIFLFATALILTIIWFHKGLVLGGGEAGIPFYNFQNELSIDKNAWVEKALGNPTGVVTALFPSFYLFSLLQNLGVSAVLLQAGLFFILLATGFLGMYLLVNRTSDNQWIAFLAALFYNLNLMAMTVVWNRFQYPFMFFYAFIPLALYFFIRGLVEKKIIFALILNLLVLCFVMFLTSVPLLFVYWILFGLYTLFFIITNIHDKKKIIWAILYFFVNIILFLIFNFWWILQFFQSFFASTYSLQESYATSDDYQIFTALSNNLGNLNYLLRLMHRDFFIWMKDVWGTIYYNPIFIVLSFLPIALIFGSVFIKNKPKEYYFYLLLAIVTVFFAKGSNDPFGGIFYFLFTHFKLLEAFRNPFEKIGLIIPLAYAPLFGFGLYNFYLYLKSKRKILAKPLTILMVIATCGILVWPMWNGWVFTSNEPPTDNTKIGDYIKVPGYYKDANTWLNQQGQDFRTIALPLKGEGLTHNWEYGYNGVDLSSSLFDKPFLAFCTGLEYLCSITNNLQPQLTHHPEDFWKVLPPLNVSYVMVRNDINYNLRSMQDPKDIFGLLNMDKEHFSLEKKFDKLSFYKLNNSFQQPKIDSAISAIYYRSPLNEAFIEAVTYADYKKGDIYIIDNGNISNFYENFSKQILLKAHLFVTSDLNVSKENAEAALPYIRFLPDSPLYIYSRFKEQFSRFVAGNNYSRELVIESDKRLVESKRLIEKKEYLLANKTLLEYRSYLQVFLKNHSIMNDKLNRMDLARQKYIFSDMKNSILNNSELSNSYDETELILNDLLYNLDIETKYPVDLTKYSSYNIHIPEDGKYQIIFETKDWNKFYKSEDIEMLIDNRDKISLSIDQTKETLEKEFNFTKGDHQIDILNPQPINLIDNGSDTKTLETEQKLINYEFPFSQFDPFGEYFVSFDYLTNKGNLPNVFVTHDTDSIKKNKLQPFSSLTIDANAYNHDWDNFSGTIASDSIAHTSKLVFQITPWNDCNLRNTGLLAARCDNKAFKTAYNKKTQVQIRSISITRKITNNMYLRKERNNLKSLSKPTITYTKINSATYLVDIRNATTPFFLSFLESFHPSWRAYYINSNNKKVLIDSKNHFLINSFANAWYVERTGNYKILLEFYPQELLTIGKKISIIGILIGTFLLIYLIKKQNHGIK